MRKETGGGRKPEAYIILIQADNGKARVVGLAPQHVRWRGHIQVAVLKLAAGPHGDEGGVGCKWIGDQRLYVVVPVQPQVHTAKGRRQRGRWVHTPRVTLHSSDPETGVHRSPEAQ